MIESVSNLYGKVAETYLARPHYPDQLFSWLSQQARSRNTAWDCGSGSGQASTDLASYFSKIIATDISNKQIEKAGQHSRISFNVAAAEVSGLPDESTDLIFVGMAAHWFDLDKFYQEALRVSKPQSILAMMVYGEPVFVDPSIDPHLKNFSNQISDFGLPQLRYVKDMYQNLPIPSYLGEELEVPELEMNAVQTLREFSSYLYSRGSVRDFIAKEKADPVHTLIETLLERNISPDTPLKITWPLSGRVIRFSK
jgi:ubiquinone/menaquinone biosynthesis C-methylase UbiE